MAKARLLCLSDSELLLPELGWDLPLPPPWSLGAAAWRRSPRGCDPRAGPGPSEAPWKVPAHSVLGEPPTGVEAHGAESSEGDLLLILYPPPPPQVSACPPRSGLFVTPPWAPTSTGHSADGGGTWEGEPKPVKTDRQDSQPRGREQVGGSVRIGGPPPPRQEQRQRPEQDQKFP